MTILCLVVSVAALIVKANPPAERTNERGVEVKNNVEDEGTFKPEMQVVCKTNDVQNFMHYGDISKREWAEESGSQPYLYGKENARVPAGLVSRRETWKIIELDPTIAIVPYLAKKS
nr:V3 [Tranosema rostrale ichnovirus]